MPLNKDQIEKAVEAFEEKQSMRNPDLSYAEELSEHYGSNSFSFLRDAKEMQVRYADLFPSAKNGEELAQIFIQEDYFNSAYEELVDLSTHDEPDRLTALEIATLYHLLVGGGLTRILEKHLEENEVEIQNIPASELLSLKVELATKFIEHAAARTKETELAKNKNAVTVGLEIELTDHLIDFINRYRELHTRLSEELGKNLSNLSIESVPDDHTNTSQGRRVRRFKDMTSFFGEIIPDKHELERIKNYIEQPGLKMLSSIDTPPFNKDIEGSHPEIQTTPSFSYRTQVRELLYMALTGAMDSEWNVHETIAGIKIGPDIMDVLLMSAAAQYVPQDIFQKFIDNEKRKKLKKGESGEMEFQEFVVADAIGKWSDVDGQFRRYSFHKARPAEELRNASYGVEIRGLLNYQIGEFPSLVRHLAFTEIASWAIKAKQSGSRDENQEKLVSLWTELQSKWKDLMAEYEIPSLTRPRDYYLTGDDRYHEIYTTKYHQVISEIILQSQIADSEMPTKARTLIREFMKEARQYIPGLERKVSKDRSGFIKRRGKRT